MDKPPPQQPHKLYLNLGQTFVSLAKIASDENFFSNYNAVLENGSLFEHLSKAVRDKSLAYQIRVRKSRNDQKDHQDNNDNNDNDNNDDGDNNDGDNDDGDNDDGDNGYNDAGDGNEEHSDNPSNVYLNSPQLTTRNPLNRTPKNKSRKENKPRKESRRARFEKYTRPRLEQEGTSNSPPPITPSQPPAANSDEVHSISDDYVGADSNELIDQDAPVPNALFSSVILLKEEILELSKQVIHVAEQTRIEFLKSRPSGTVVINNKNTRTVLADRPVLPTATKHKFQFQKLYDLQNKTRSRTNPRSAWVDDESIDAYGDLLNKRSVDYNIHPRTVVATSYDYMHIKDAVTDENKTLMENGIKKKLESGFKEGRIPCVLFPFNYHKVHWIIIRVDFENYQIEIYDSMAKITSEKKPGEYKADMIAAGKIVLVWIKAVLDLFASDKYKSVTTAHEQTNTNFFFQIKKLIPQQKNENDCGIFVLKYAELLTRGKTITPESFSTADITLFRTQFAAELMQMHLLVPPT